MGVDLERIYVTEPERTPQGKLRFMDSRIGRARVACDAGCRS